MAAGQSAFGSNELPAVEEPTTIWIPDERLGFKLANVVERNETGVLVKFKNKENVFEEVRSDIIMVGCVCMLVIQMEVPSDEAQEVNPTAFELCEDMASLTHLNEASVLHNLRQRFLLDLIHVSDDLSFVLRLGA